MAILNNVYDKEKIGELAKKIKEKKIVVSLEFQALLFKALENTSSFTLDNVKVMQEELGRQFPFFYDYNVGEIKSCLNSIEEVLKKKSLIL